MAEDICHGPKGFCEIKRCTRIESTSRVVPAKHMGSSSHHLSNRYSFALASRNAADELITDQRICGVRDIQHAKQSVQNFCVELFACQARQSTVGAWGLQRQRKPKGLPDRERRDMNIICYEI